MICAYYFTDCLTRYLKQEIAAPSSEGGRFTSVTWHPEKPRQILLTTKSWSSLTFFEETTPFTLLVSAEVMSYSCRWETYAATALVPHDTGTVAVVDGCVFLLLLYVASLCDFYFYPQLLSFSRRSGCRMSHLPCLLIGSPSGARRPHPLEPCKRRVTSRFLPKKMY